MQKNWRIAARHNGLWDFQIDENIWKTPLSLWYPERTFPFHCEGSLLDFNFEMVWVVDWAVSLLKLSTDAWKSDNERRVSSASSGLWLFCCCLILITICSLLVFMLVRGGRWIFSKAPVERDVKTVTSIKSLHFLLWDESKRKSLESGQSVFFYFEEEINDKTSTEIEEDYWELSVYPSLRSWHKLLRFDSLVVPFKLNVGICIRT